MSLLDAAPFAAAAWNFDESSGNRFDQVGSSTFGDNGLVGSTTGVFATAANFNGSDQYLDAGDNGSLSAGDIDFMIRIWVKLNNKSANDMHILVKGVHLTDPEYGLRWIQAQDMFMFSVWGSAGGGDPQSISASNFGSPSTGVWNLIHAWHDSVNNEISIAVNAGVPNSSSHTAGIFSTTANELFAGSDGTENFWDGDMDDPVLLKNRFLSDLERNLDFNGGAGVAYADWDVFTGGGAIGGSFPIRRFYRPAAFAPGNAR